jgi:hypothetical protein
MTCNGNSEIQKDVPTTARCVPINSYIINCTACGAMCCTGVAWCERCLGGWTGDSHWCEISQLDLDRIMLSMPMDWPGRGDHEAFIRRAAERHPEHVMDPWWKE